MQRSWRTWKGRGFLSPLESAISDSSRLTLIYRTHFFRHFAKSPDLVAESLVDRIGNWPEVFKTPIATFNSLNLGRRAWLTDQLSREWLTDHPQGLILNLGCGLDTLFHRLPQGDWEGINLDQAEVMAARKQLVQERSNTHSMVATLAETSWLSTIPRERPTLIVLNGVIPYMNARHAHNLLLELSTYFLNAMLVFDVCSRPGRWLTNASICVHGLNGAYFQTSNTDLPDLKIVKRYNLSDFSSHENLDMTTRLLGSFATAIRLNSLYVVKVGSSQ